MALNHRMILFAHHYLNDAKMDPVRAAEMAGYAKPDKVCGALLSNPRLKAYLLKKAEEAGVMPVEEVLARWTTIAAFDPLEFLEHATEQNRAGDDVERASFNLKKLKKKGLGYLVKKIDIKPSGHVEIEFHDGAAALDKISKFHGMTKERVEITHVGDGSTERIVAILGGLAQLAGAMQPRTGGGEAEPGALCDRGEQWEVEARPAPDADQPTLALDRPEGD
jgi:hypothetical protein